MPRVKIQEKDMDDIFGILNDNRTKEPIVVIFFLQKETKTCGGRRGMQRA